jgi:hypothetical protein
MRRFVWFAAAGLALTLGTSAKAQFADFFSSKPKPYYQQPIDTTKQAFPVPTGALGGFSLSSLLPAVSSPAGKYGTFPTYQIPTQSQYAPSDFLKYWHYQGPAY